MTTTVSSRRYAQAAFQIAHEMSKLEEWRGDLRKVAQQTEDSELISLLDNPRLPFESKVKLIHGRLSEIDPLALNLAYLLVVKGKFKSATLIAEQYERLLDDYYGIKHGEVTTALPLDNTNKERLARRLEAIVGTKVSISLQVDPNILGGFLARIDDSLIDGSLRNKLQVLRKGLAGTRT